MQQDARGTTVDAHDCREARLVLILVGFDLKTASSECSNVLVKRTVPHFGRA